MAAPFCLMRGGFLLGAAWFACRADKGALGFSIGEENAVDLQVVIPLEGFDPVVAKLFAFYTVIL